MAKSMECSLFWIQENFSLNLQDLALVGPTKENLVLDVLAVQHLNNRLTIVYKKIKKNLNSK